MEAKDEFKVVAEALSKAVNSKLIKQPFITTEDSYGRILNVAEVEGTPFKFYHFHAAVPLEIS